MYNKLFTKILDSSIWLEPTSTRIVWVTLLAAMDADGYAHFSAIDNLAGRARVTTAEAEAAIKCFLEPDENSENKSHEGRRVERVPGGYMILNFQAHRDMVNRDVQRYQTRQRVAKHRELKNKKQAKKTADKPMSEVEGEAANREKRYLAALEAGDTELADKIAAEKTS